VVDKVSEKPKIVCLMGPTASGKTDLAIKLTQDYSFDIISVDSAMVYRGMDIGTAKPSAEELKLAPHRLIDICDPVENYSAGQFCLDARREIKDIIQHNRIPLLVGGTMLYFHLLQRGETEIPERDLTIRHEIKQTAEKIGWEKLHVRLAEIDPAAAKQIHFNDTQRISRALEIYYSTGKTLTEVQAQQNWQALPYEIINIIIHPPDRTVIHERIARRFDVMLEKGLISEVEKLFNRGDLNYNSTSIRTVGYRQVWSYLAGEYPLDIMRERAIIATRQFAKRQMTWLRQWETAARFNSNDADFYGNIKDFLRRFALHEGRKG